MLATKPIAVAVEKALNEVNGDNKEQHIFGVKTEGNLSWDELDLTYNDLAKGIINIGTTVNSFTQIKEVYPYLQQNSPDEINTLVQGLSSDLDMLTDILLLIRSQHENLHGAITNEDEVSHAATIMGEYSRFATQLQAVTMESSTHISSSFELALAKMCEVAPEDYANVLSKYFKSENE